MKAICSLKKMHPHAKEIIQVNGRYYILTDNGKFALCKKCGLVLGAHKCRK